MPDLKPYLTQRANVGVDGVDVVIGTSSFLREFSHGKDMAYITKTAIEVIEYVKSKGTSFFCLPVVLYLLQLFRHRSPILVGRLLPIGPC